MNCSKSIFAFVSFAVFFILVCFGVSELVNLIAPNLFLGGKWARLILIMFIFGIQAAAFCKKFEIVLKPKDNKDGAAPPTESDSSKSKTIERVHFDD